MIVDTEWDSFGVTAVPPGGFEELAMGPRARHGDALVVLADMVGSNRGWVDAGYVATPATLETLAAAVVRPMGGVLIIPGVRYVADGRGDVLRGEEA